MRKYFGCAWNAIASGLFVLGLLEVLHVIGLNMLLVGMLVIISIVVAELALAGSKSLQRRRVRAYE